MSSVQPHNQTAISVSARAVGRYAVIRLTGRLAVADGKRTILSFIYFLLFKERTPAEWEKLQGDAQCWSTYDLYDLCDLWKRPNGVTGAPRLRPSFETPKASSFAKASDFANISFIASAKEKASSDSSADTLLGKPALLI